MAFITRLTARQAVTKLLGDFYSGTTDGSGNTTTTAKATGVFDQYRDNWFAGKWFYIPSTGEERNLDSSSNSAKTVTWTGAIAATPNTVGFEVMFAQPSVVHSEINNAIDTLWPQVSIERVDYFVGGTVLKNAWMQDWTSSTVPAAWTLTGTPTITRTNDDTFTLAGLYSLKMAGNDVSTPSISQYVQVGGMNNFTFTAWALVYCRVASGVSLIITDDAGSTASTGAALHGGTGWEVLTVSKSITTSAAGAAANPKVLVQHATNASSTVSYTQAVWTSAGKLVNEYRLPSFMKYVVSVESGQFAPTGISALVFSNRSPSRIWRPAKWFPDKLPDVGTDARYHAIRVEKLGFNIVYRVKGFSPLSKPAAETDVIELEDHDARILYVQAAILVIDRLPALISQKLLPRRVLLERELAGQLGKYGSPLYSLG